MQMEVKLKNSNDNPSDLHSLMKSTTLLLNTKHRKKLTNNEIYYFISHQCRASDLIGIAKNIGYFHDRGAIEIRRN